MENEYFTLNLPSRGECYPSKKGTVEIRQMTVSDEDMFTVDVVDDSFSAVDLLIDRCLKTLDLSASNMCAADREFVMLWLRINAYGSEYEYIDSKSGETKTFDLSTIKYIETDERGDENGYFTINYGKDCVKVKFLTHYEDNEMYIRMKLAYGNSRGDEKAVLKAMLMPCIVSINDETSDNYKEEWFDSKDVEEIKDFSAMLYKIMPRIDGEGQIVLDLSDSILINAVIKKN